MVAIRIWLFTSARAIRGKAEHAAAAPAACIKNVRRVCLVIAVLQYVQKIESFRRGVVQPHS